MNVMWLYVAKNIKMEQFTYCYERYDVKIVVMKEKTKLYLENEFVFSVLFVEKKKIRIKNESTSAGLEI